MCGVFLLGRVHGSLSTLLEREDLLDGLASEAAGRRVSREKGSVFLFPSPPVVDTRGRGLIQFRRARLVAALVLVVRLRTRTCVGRLAQLLVGPSTKDSDAWVCRVSIPVKVHHHPTRPADIPSPRPDERLVVCFSPVLSSHRALSWSAKCHGESVGRSWRRNGGRPVRNRHAVCLFVSCVLQPFLCRREGQGCVRREHVDRHTHAHTHTLTAAR